MKRYLYVYTLILIAIFAVFSYLDRDGNYVVEKKLWKIHKEFMELTKDPDVVPDQTYDMIARKYINVIERYPESTLVRGVHLLIGDIYIKKGDYREARKRYQEVLKLFADNVEFSAEVKSRIGKAFEAEGSWKQAETIYQDLIKEYPETIVGLSMPLYIAHHYKSANAYQETVNAYDTAIAHYKNIISSNEGTVIGFKAIQLLSNCYLDQKRWHEALDILKQVLKSYASAKYLNPQKFNYIVKTINVVSAYKLKDYDVAINLYKEVIEHNPDHAVRPYLEKIIEGFETLKAKGVVVSDKSDTALPKLQSQPSQ